MGKAPLSLCTHSTHGCCPGSADKCSWGACGSCVREEQLCLGELIVSHLSEIISQPPAKPGKRLALVSCGDVAHATAVILGCKGGGSPELPRLRPKRNLLVQLFWHHLQPFSRSPGVQPCISQAPRLLGSEGPPICWTLPQWDTMSCRSLSLVAADSARAQPRAQPGQGGVMRPLLFHLPVAMQVCQDVGCPPRSPHSRALGKP